jgi:hypothetical protein
MAGKRNDRRGPRGKAVKPKKTLRRTTAFQASDDQAAQHVVGIGNLRVTITRDGPFWLAQGLEIDYFAQGDSLADAKQNFQDGLAATIRAHLSRFGTIQKVLKVAPQRVWDQLVTTGTYHLHSQVSFHDLVPAIKEIPYEAIDYLAAA